MLEPARELSALVQGRFKGSNCLGRDAGAIVVEGVVDDSGKLSKD